MTLSMFEWLSEIFNETKHAISLRQLSYMFKISCSHIFW